MVLNTHPADRKAMVRAISELLGIPAVYMRTPTYDFQIGPVTVHRDGTTECSDASVLDRVTAMLSENNWLDGTDTQAAPTADCGFPVNDLKPAGFTNILRTLYARQKLIGAMTKCASLRIDEELITLLQDEKAETTERISELLNSEIRADMVKGIRLENGMLFFDTDSEPARQLFGRIVLHASAAHHMSAKRIEPSAGEMKYFCRSWLMQLGMGTADLKETRAALLDHLDGYAAFRTAEAMEKHKQKVAEKRRALRESEVQKND